MRILSLALVTLGLLAAQPSGTSHAATIGAVPDSAPLGRPLSLAMPVRLDDGEELEPSCVSVEVWMGDRRVAPDRVHWVLQGSPQSRDRIVRVQTTVSIDEPVVFVQAAVGCASRMSRRFTLLADPDTAEPAPVMAAPQAAAVATVPVPLPGAAAAVSASAVSEAKRPDATVGVAPVPAARPPRSTRASRLRESRRTQTATASRKTVQRSTLRVLPLAPQAGVVTPAPGSNASAAAAAASAVEAAWAAASAAQAAASSAEARVMQLEAQVRQLTLESRAQAASANFADSASAPAAASPTSPPKPRTTPAQSRPDQLWWIVLTLSALVIVGGMGWMVWRQRLNGRRRGSSLLDGLSAEEREALGAVRGSQDSPTTDAAPTLLPPEFSTNSSEVPLVPSPFKPEIPVVSALTETSWGMAKPAREVSVEELIDLEQQAEFFVVLGQDDAAIDLLVTHIRQTGGVSPLPYLKLLEIFGRQGDSDGYERTRARFNQRFNAYAPDWNADLSHGRSLEDYPAVIKVLQANWSHPVDVMAELESMLFRKTDDQMFDLPAYRELLMLYSVARDLLKAGDVQSLSAVDLLLPLSGPRASDAGQAGRTGPEAAREDAASWAEQTQSLPREQSMDWVTVPGALDLDLNLGEGDVDEVRATLPDLGDATRGQVARPSAPPALGAGTDRSGSGGGPIDFEPPSFKL